MRINRSTESNRVIIAGYYKITYSAPTQSKTLDL